MGQYSLLVIARGQTLVGRLQRVVDPEQCSIHWAASTRQAMGLDTHPDLLVVDLPPSGGVRTIAQLKRRFPVPVLAVQRPGRPPIPEIDATFPSTVEPTQLAGLVESTLRTSTLGIVRAPGMSLDTTTRRLEVNGDSLQLPPLACQILAVLMRRPGRVVFRDELFRRVWQTEYRDSSRALDVHVAILRRLMEPDPRRPKLIVTERGFGYRFDPPEQTPA